MTAQNLLVHLFFRRGVDLALRYHCFFPGYTRSNARAKGTHEVTTVGTHKRQTNDSGPNKTTCCNVSKWSQLDSLRVFVSPCQRGPCLETKKSLVPRVDLWTKRKSAASCDLGQRSFFFPLRRKKNGRRAVSAPKNGQVQLQVEGVAFKYGQLSGEKKLLTNARARFTQHSESGEATRNACHRI